MDDARIFVDRGGAVTMTVIVVLDGIAARIARMRTEYGNQPRENGAQQRQKDDCLNHQQIPLRMISEQTNWFVRENRLPLFRIMRRQPFIKLTSSTAIEPRLRKYTTSTARPIAASAAATVSTSSPNTGPTMSPRTA